MTDQGVDGRGFAGVRPPGKGNLGGKRRRQAGGIGDRNLELGVAEQGHGSADQCGNCAAIAEARGDDESASIEYYDSDTICF